MEMNQLDTLTALVSDERYSAEELIELLPYVAAYLRSREALRKLPLGEARSAFSLLAGGRR